LFEILLENKKLFPFTSIQNQYRFEGTGFPTIPQLIEHHYTTKQVITKKSGVVLLNPVVKVMHTFQELYLTEKYLGELYCCLKYVTVQLLGRFFHSCLFSDSLFLSFFNLLRSVQHIPLK